MILNSTQSISVQVSNRFGNDSTTYANITDTGNVFIDLIVANFISIVLNCRPPYSSVIAIYSMSSISSLSSILSSSNNIIIANNFVMICALVISTTSTTSQFITASSSSVPSLVDNIIPIVIGTTVPIMILLTTVILLLIVFLANVCYKRDKVFIIALFFT